MITCRLTTLLLILAATAAASDRTYKTCAPGRTDMAIAYGDVVSCSTTSITESDLYRFTAVANDVIYMKFLGPDASYNNTCAEILDPAGASVWFGCRQNSASLTLATAGQYTIRMWENGSNELMAYSFSLEREVPIPVSTKPIRFSTPINGSLTIMPDRDYYMFSGIAGDRIRIDATGPDTSYNNICVRVYYDQPPRKELAFGCRSGTHFDLTLPQTTSYMVYVWENGENETANYILEMTCMFGTCRDDPFPSLNTTLTGCTTCKVGDTYSAKITLVNTTAPLRASELKLGFLAPDGTPINIGDPHIDVGESFTFDGEVIRTVIKPEQAKGAWQFCANLIEANLGTLRLSSCQKFTIQ